MLFTVWSEWSECQSITHLDLYSSCRPEVNRASILTPEDMGLCFASAVLQLHVLGQVPDTLWASTSSLMGWLAPTAADGLCNQHSCWKVDFWGWMWKSFMSCEASWSLFGPLVLCDKDLSFRRDREVREKQVSLQSQPHRTEGFRKDHMGSSQRLQEPGLASTQGGGTCFSYFKNLSS